MTKSHAILIGPLFIAIAAIIFCVWIALGNDVNFCVTTGCSLYQDTSFFGVSMWWFGTAAFTVLAACALLGQKRIGQWFGALFIFADIFLLGLMELTAPCVSCLVVAALFALCYWLFREPREARPSPGAFSGRSPLLLIWLVLFIANLGTVARSQFDVWPILDESGDAKMRMFFSPSCPYCVDGIKVLSGNIDVAFYPVAENENDVYRLAKMLSLVEDGMGLAEALAQSAEFADAKNTGYLNPEMLVLRFRLLRNKAHLFAAGSKAVPFFETRGLPGDITARLKASQAPPVPARPGDGTPKDHELPKELEISGQCGGLEPCPPRS